MIEYGDGTQTPWRNGLGRKANLAGDDDWSVTLAWLDADAAFSDFAGFDRTQTLLEGAGFVLEFDDGHRPITVDRPYVPVCYDGAWPVRARLLDGPCLVLNLIGRQGHA